MKNRLYSKLSQRKSMTEPTYSASILFASLVSNNTEERVHNNVRLGCTRGAHLQ